MKITKRSSVRLTSYLLLLTSIFLLALPAQAQPPDLIHYQGRLVDGTNLVNGTVELELSLYDADTGGTLLYTDSNPSVTVIDGLYNTHIGANTTFGVLDTALTNAQVWLQVVVDGTPLSPRERLASVPYARAVHGLQVAYTNNIVLGSEAGLHHIHPAALHGLIGGGVSNWMDNVWYGVIAGGATNRIGEFRDYSAIGGGANNFIGGGGGLYAVIAGGFSNRVSGHNAAIGGGWHNIASGTDSTIGGGHGNIAWDARSVVSGGYNNVAYYGASAGGGSFNQALGVHSVVAGGFSNLTSGSNAMIPGGNRNEATTLAFAAGRRAKAVHAGAFVWGDSTDADVESTADDQVTFRANGGFRILGGAIEGDASGLSNFPAVVIQNTSTATGGLALNPSNEATGDHATAVGGQSNTATAIYAFVGGGSQNSATGWGSVVGGGGGNIAAGGVLGFTTIGGGIYNFASGLYSTIAGGWSNTVSASGAVVSGGLFNSAIGEMSAVGGGQNNTAGGNHSAIAGGQGNLANAWSSSIGGGAGNQALGLVSTIGGGLHNEAEGDYVFVGGGTSNTAAGIYAFVGGGQENIVNTGTEHSTVVAGFGNEIEASSTFGFIGGGYANTIRKGAAGAVIAGGNLNQIATNIIGATVSGGFQNEAIGNFAMIPGGQLNTASNYAFAAGRRAKALHAGSFVWGDSTNADIESTDPNQVIFRANGGFHVVGGPTEGAFGGIHITGSNRDLSVPAGEHMTFGHLTSGIFVEAMRIDNMGYVGIGVIDPTNQLHVAGNVQAASFITSSDRDAKTNIEPVTPQAILEQVRELPIATWSFRDRPDAMHIGPMAQDFHAAFGFGTTDTGIATVDVDGVALAAIQALAEQNQQLADENAQLRNELEAIKRHLGL